LETAFNIFDAPSALGFNQDQTFLAHADPLPPAEAEAMLLRLLDWRAQRNLYAPGAASVHWSSDETVEPPSRPKSAAEWKRFWSYTDNDLLEGPVSYEGGDLLSRLMVEAEKLTPQEFRLRPDSAGRHAGPDGQDLGANVDFVGPGAAYERWKKTPEYRRWLQDTAQVK
jgi:hypothetical protein